MRTTFLLYLMSGILVCSGIPVFGQSREQKKEDKRYAERSREVYNEIIGDADTMFTGNSVPGEYSMSPAVILAKRIDLFSDLKSNLRYSNFYGHDITKAVRYSLTIREKIKIQDKHSLKEYSGFSFSQIRNQSSFFKSVAYTFVGIRIIKPDGSSKTVDIDAELVNNQSERDKDPYKLAIPGLEVGDILDMYIRIEKESGSEDVIDPMDVVIGGAYPIVKYSFNVKVRNNFAVVYTTANIAQDLMQTTDDDFIYLNARFNDISKSADELWVYERRELPVVKINIIPGAPAQSTYKTYEPKKGEIVKGLPKAWIDNYLTLKLGSSIRTLHDRRVVLLKEYIKKQVREKKLNTGDFDSLIATIYYYGRYLYLYNYISDKVVQVNVERNTAGTGYDFYSYLMEALTAYYIDFDVLFTVPRNSGTIYTIASFNELSFFVRAKGKETHYLVPPHMFTLSNSFPAIFEGQDAYVFKNNSLRLGNRSSIEKLPYTKSSFNQLQENLQLSVNKRDPQLLDIVRTRSIRGNPAYDNQLSLSLFEEYNEQERALLHEPSFASQLELNAGKKKAPQLLKKYEKAFAEARKTRFDLARSELGSTFESKAITLDSIRVLQMGNRHTAPDFIFNEQFSIGGLVKKAGSNYIIEIGSLINGQVQVKPDQRTREYGINMPYARSYVYDISMAVPEGFTVEGISNLNKNVSNETGSFKSESSVENDVLRIKVSKVYNHYYEKAANWEKLLEFLDAAYNFSLENVLLKRK